MHVIPVPASVQWLEGIFLLKHHFSVFSDGEEAASVVAYLTQQLESKYGLTATVEATQQTAVLVIDIQNTIEDLDHIQNRNEGYLLRVTTEGISIRAETRIGLFHGIQSFFQLLPPHSKLHPSDVEIECLQIVDAPRFRWRGALLDVGRHFFSVDFIKRFLDHMAFYKLNIFHWHLTEDQGWRIEIHAHPRLTEIGAWRETETGSEKYGGFYSQSEIADIVAYAKERCIDVMPEIEMPGHCAASLAAYPELSCKEESLDTPSEWGVYEDVYCAGKDRVLVFLQSVLDEVMELFPFEYIHIGGDETPKERWRHCLKCQERIQKQELNGEDELQSWFINQMGDYVSEKRRKIVGWDEILEGGIPNNAAVMSWRGIMGGCIAAKLGHDVIMTPTSHCYFDYKQSDSQEEPGAYYAKLTLEDVYAFDPIPDSRRWSRMESPEDSHHLPSHMETSEMSETTVDTAAMEWDEDASKGETEQPQNGQRPEQKLAEDIQNGRMPTALTPSEQEHILGGQANVWTEYIDNADTCEYMLLPRLCAFSEAVWSLKGEKDWDGFNRRLEEHVKYFEAFGFKYRSLLKWTQS